MGSSTLGKEGVYFTGVLSYDPGVVPAVAVVAARLADYQCRHTPLMGCLHSVMPPVVAWR